MGNLTTFEHPVNLPREKALEGKYPIQTEELKPSAIEAVTVYKDLSEVERAFSELRTSLKFGPYIIRRDSRLQAHIFIASLAFLLDQALEKKPKAAGMDISSKQAWQILRTVWQLAQRLPV